MRDSDCLIGDVHERKSRYRCLYGKPKQNDANEIVVVGTVIVSLCI